MKLKYDFVINDVAGDTVAVSVGNTDGRFNGFIRLNETGAFIFNMLKQDVTREEIVASILKEYKDATPSDAKDTVDEFIEKLQKAELLI